MVAPTAADLLMKPRKHEENISKQPFGFFVADSLFSYIGYLHFCRGFADPVSRALAFKGVAIQNGEDFTITVNPGFHSTVVEELVGDKFTNRIKLVGGLVAINFLFSHILGMSSSQLTKSYFSEGWLNHQQNKTMQDKVGDGTIFPRC